MRGLLGLSARSLREQRTRALLTIAGMTLGVALFTGAIVTVNIASGLIDQLTTDLNGTADAVAVAPGGGANAISGINDLPPNAAAIVASLPDVARTAPVLTMSSSIVTDRGDTTKWKVNQPPPVILTGVDIPAATAIYALSAREGRLPNPTGNEVALSHALAASLSTKPGDTVALDTPTGRSRFFVVGILEKRGIGRVGRVALASLQSARNAAGRPAALSQVAIKLNDGVDPDAWVAAHAELVGQGIVLNNAADSLHELTASVQTVTTTLIGIGAGVVLIGGFLVYLTMSMAVIERTRLFGILSAVGATAKQVRRLVLIESGILGALSSALGVPLGIGVAALVRLATSRLLAQAGQPDVPLTAPPMLLLLGSISGVVGAVTAGLIPARAASRLDPVDAIRGEQEPNKPRNLVPAIGAAVLVVGAIVLFAAHGTAPLAGGIVLCLCGAITAVPIALSRIAPVVGSVCSRLSRGTGDVAVLHLTKERTRSAYTVGLLMVVLALVVATSGIYASLAKSTETQVDRVFGNDLSLDAASAFDASFVDDLRRLPGVESVTEQAIGRTEVEQGPDTFGVGLVSLDPANYFNVGSFAWVDGNDTSARARLSAQGGGVLIPAGFAERVGAQRGDFLTLRTPQGPQRLRIAGTIEAFSVPPTIYIDNANATRLYGMDRPQLLQVNVAAGNTPEQLRARIEATLGNRTTFIVSTADELKSDVRAQVAAGTNAIFVLLLLAGVVGLLGLANTLAMSVVVRYREIGVLRAIGGGTRQIRGLVVVEAVTLSAIAVVLAVPLGALIARPMLDTVARGLGSYDVPYSFPWAALPTVVVAGLVIAALAAYAPARRATRVDVDAALRVE